MRSWILAVALVLMPVRGEAARCPGDCDADGRIEIAELVRSVRAVLEDSAEVPCLGNDATPAAVFSVADLVVAVHAAREGCTALTPTPPPTPTPSPTVNGFTGTIADLFPHAKGDTLIYRVTEDGEAFEETNEVLDVQSDGAFTVDSRSTDTHQQRQYVDAVQQLALTITDDLREDVRTACRPGSLLLQLPLTVGQSYERFSICEVRTISGGRRLGSYRQDNRVTLVSVGGELSVPAGTYTNVLHVSLRITFSGGGSGMETHEIDIVPGIGAIRERSLLGTQVIERELVDGTVAGRPVRP